MEGNTVSNRLRWSSFAGYLVSMTKVGEFSVSCIFKATLPIEQGKKCKSRFFGDSQGLSLKKFTYGEMRVGRRLDAASELP